MKVSEMENNTQVTNVMTTEKDVKVHVITVILAEELSSIRQSLRLLLDSQPDIKVIGEANNGLDALDLIGNLHPEILLLGLTASNTLEIVRLINQRYPKTGIIVPYKPGNDKHIQEILRYGIKACILKTGSNVNLLNAIREWGNHQKHLSVSGLKDIPRDFVLHGAQDTLDAYDVLTPGSVKS